MKKILVLVIVAWLSPAFAQVANSWIKSTSGNWEDQTAWSLGVRPAPGQTIMLTNQGWKAMAIGSATTASFPQSLNVESVIVAANTDSFNLLLLNYAGTDVPLQATNGLSIFAGGQVQSLYSGLIVQNGSLTVSNSQFIQVGGLVVTTNSWLRLQNSTYYLTNGLLQAGQVNLGLNQYGSLVQDGGSANMTSLQVGSFAPGGPSANSVYDLYSGYLYVSQTLELSSLSGLAIFNQHGGTNFAGLLLLEPDLSSAPSLYNLSGGVLCANDAAVSGAGNSSFFTQTGGDCFVTNTMLLRGGTAHGTRAHEVVVQLSGGTLSAGSLQISGHEGYSTFTQSNGITRVSQNIFLDGGSYLGNLNLAGGTLACSNISSGSAGISILQTGGVLIVSNLFSYSGQYSPWGGSPKYNFNDGTLSASNIELFAAWWIGSSAQAGRITNPGWFKMGFTILHIGDANEHLGRFILATSAVDPGDGQSPSITNSVISLDGTSSRLSFADSSAETWVPGTILVINNWNGNQSGGGAEQLKFGTGASGLTSAQLGQIRFNNPAGLPSGTYPAKILSTGEIVPDTSGTSASGLVNNWVNPSSAKWEDSPSWSLGSLPGPGETVTITNQGWKAVAIGASTAQNFPASMTVSNLTVRGAWDTENVLLLNYAGTAVPLTVLNGVTLQDDGRIVNFNSGLVVQAGTIVITNATMIQDGGFVRVTNAVMNLDSAEYDLTNGVFKAGEVSLGFGVAARFNQYGGAAVISNLDFGRGHNGTGGAYALYGGYLSLPGGLSLTADGNGSSSYLQEGGSNQTTQIYIEPGYAGGLVSFKLDGGLLADSGVDVFADNFGSAALEQNGGTHVITNTLSIVGSSHNGFTVNPAAYNLNGGTLSAGTIGLSASAGDAVFVQSNGTTRVGTFQAYSAGYYLDHNTHVTLASGLLSCSNFTTVDGGARFNQTGGALVVSNLLDFGGARDVGGPAGVIYGRYTFTGGTVSASNINLTGDWIIGDGSANRISNPGFFSLAHTLTISNAVEQLGGFILASNAMIDLAGSASRLSFANSSSEVWAGGATLTVSDWNGSLSGGGAEQLKFGTSASGLTPSQVSQLAFNNPAGLSAGTYSAKILSSGEIVPLPRPVLLSSRSGSALVLTWSGNFQLLSATNVGGPYTPVSGAISPWTNQFTKPREFFSLQGK